MMARSNDSAAQMLQEFAELLAISGGEAFKVRAYEKAARSVAGYPGEIADLDEKGLNAIPGVGAHLARKIIEFRDSGSVHELDELRARIPAGLRTLLVVPGLGPRRARQVYDELGITSVGDLLDALHDQRLRGLRGWGERSEAALAQAIRDAQAGGRRIHLDVALDLAEQMLAELAELPSVQRAASAGSLRRMRETVGDIDLLVTSNRADDVMQAFCASRRVARVLAHGPTKASVLTTKGVQVDLRVVEPAVWGAALLYFTGSKPHNIQVRTLALRAGLKLSEYGLFDAESGEQIAAATEEEVYDRLGLPWIPPTLREDRGEIQAALDGRLPQLVQDRDIRGDLHVHTNLTDGVASMEQMVAAARARGYAYCAITDHAPQLYMERMTTEKMLAQRRQLRDLEPTAGIGLLHGTELNIAPDGSLDWDDEFLAGFDVVVASVHSLLRQSREEMTARLVRAISNPNVDIIGHPTTRLIGHRPPIDVDVDEIFAAAARTGTALEVNSFPDRLDLDDELVYRAKRAGVQFAICTDAHAVPHLGYLRLGVATAQRGWAETTDVINTYPLPKLRRFLADGKPTPKSRSGRLLASRVRADAGIDGPGRKVRCGCRVGC
jgi:DNA polymerase (family 10)